MDTVIKELIEEKWNGKVKIFKLKQFSDDRGMVCETFRIDDEFTSEGKMCYISDTEPFVMRGPHEHISQRDQFISWKNHMVYELYNPDTSEMFHFITDPNEIYLVSVDIGIIHAYRNIEFTPIKTMNFPTSLFMGENKSEEIDEIRHEELIPNNKSIIVIGADGRLGKSLLNQLYKNNGYYRANIIPVYKKLLNEQDVMSTLLSIKNQVEDTEVVIVNCAAMTNVQENDRSMMWANCDLPYNLANICDMMRWHLIAFSTDYVFQEAKDKCHLSTYTHSKKAMERVLNNFNYPKTTILRVANLFSDDEKDTHNIIHKMWNRVNKNEEITIDPEVVVCPTDVDMLSSYLAENLINFDKFIINDKYTIINLIPNKTYKLDEFLLEFFQYTKINRCEGKIKPWFYDFYNSNDEKDIIFNSEDTIINIVNRLKGE